MAKKKTIAHPTPSRRLVEQLSKAVELIESGQAMEALPILEKLHQTQPNNPDILFPLAQAYQDLQDLNGFERALRRLYKLKPRFPEIVLGLAGAYLINARPTLALQTFQGFLQRWPDHPEADEARKAVIVLEKEVRKQEAETGLEGEKAKEVLSLHEELRFCMENGQFQRGKQIAEQILRLHPGFIPALNNLGQIQAVQGDFEQAIETAQKVLAIEPDNVHALSNLTRLHFLRGELIEAQQFAALLKSTTAEASDRWTKVAEALTFLGDDEGVLEVYRQAKEAGDLKSDNVDEIFYHLAAVAAYRLGHVKRARGLWNDSLRINQNFDWARKNLDDMSKPPEERHGPWAYPFESWLLSGIVHDLIRLLDRNKSIGGKIELQKRVVQFLEKYPQITFLAPYLIERGDVKACEFVVRLTAVSGHPDLVQVAKSFLTGKRGSNDLRLHCGKMLLEAGLLSNRTLRMWTGREWSDILLLNIEINDETEAEKLPWEIEKLSQEAYDALQGRDGFRAQAVLEKAIELWPNDPHLLNNLALAYELQGKRDEAHQMIHEIHASFPDYFFGIVGVARLAIAGGKLEPAQDMLESLLQRKRMHPSEYNALCTAEIELWLAKGKPEAAKTWMEMLERIDHKSPELSRFRRVVG